LLIILKKPKIQILAKLLKISREEERLEYSKERKDFQELYPDCVKKL